ESLAWTLWHPPIPWTKRSTHGAAYINSTGTVLIAAGAGEGTSLINETWQRLNGRWTRVMDVPAAVYRPAMAYDRAGDRVVLFGGGLAPGYSDLTYQYKSGAWSPVSSTMHPAGRTAAAMAYDEVRGKLVLFGGASDVAVYNDTWTLDATGWTKVT